MDLTVLLVTYYSADHLAACAAALEPALAGLRAHIVVADNASTDGSADLAARLWPAATVIRNERNVGFGAAVNQALTAARGRAVLLLNPDAQPEPGAIMALLAHLDCHPTVGIVAPRLLDPTGQPVLSCYPFLTPAGVAWAHLRLGRWLPDRLHGRYARVALDPQAAAPVVVDWAQGACLLLRRAMLDAIGGFDERFVFFAEEVDLCRRAALAGWRTDYLPAARVRHRESSSAARVAGFKLASHYYSKLLYFAKHHPGAATTQVRLILLLDLTLRVVYRAWGALCRQPPDAPQRLRAYLAIMRALLTDSPDHLARCWRAQAAAAKPEERGTSRQG
jgi:GT2 family glycosyltransferase